MYFTNSNDWSSLYFILQQEMFFKQDLSYGSNEIITMYTGKTPIENLKEITSQNKKKKIFKKNFRK